MFCENCGAQIPNTAKFCKYCGAKQTPMAGPSEGAPSEGIQAAATLPAAGNAPSPGGKKALIEYLDALHTAEMGVLYSDELINQLTGQKNEYCAKHQAEFRWKTFSGPAITPRKDLIAEHNEKIAFYERLLKENKTAMKRKGDFSSWVAKMAVRNDRRQLHADYEQTLRQLRAEANTVLPRKQAEEDRRYKAECDAWRKEEALFDKAEKGRKAIYDEAEKAVCRSFDESIADAQQKKSEFTALRDELYAENILFEKFRTPVAVCQLRDYLKMGLVDQLEGPQGGYSFYLSELHAQRICGSIEELQVSMEQNLGTVIGQMSTLIHEMRSANQRLAALRNVLSNCCDTITAGFHNTKTAVFKMSAQLREELASQAQPIREAVQRSEYNIYLDGMRKELDRYRYGRLQYPSKDLPK